MKFYVASSWRNKVQPSIVELLRAGGHEVFDFKESKRWAGKSVHRNSIIFERDYEAMQWADAFVLVLPCGKSSHLELGWAAGQGKPTCILAQTTSRLELMYKLADAVVTSQENLLVWVEYDASLL